jgi:hypothetical protein
VHREVHGFHVAQDGVRCGIPIRYAGGDSSFVSGETSAVDLKTFYLRGCDRFRAKQESRKLLEVVFAGAAECSEGPLGVGHIRRQFSAQIQRVGGQ